MADSANRQNGRSFGQYTYLACNMKYVSVASSAWLKKSKVGQKATIMSLKLELIYTVFRVVAFINTRRHCSWIHFWIWEMTVKNFRYSIKFYGRILAFPFTLIFTQVKVVQITYIRTMGNTFIIDKSLNFDIVKKSLISRRVLSNFFTLPSNVNAKFFTGLL